MTQDESTPVCPDMHELPIPPAAHSQIRVPLIERQQFLRYLLAGGWNTIFGYACYAAFVALYTRLLSPRRLSLTVDVASITATAIGVTMSFFTYKLFVFRTQGNYLKEWLRCLFVYGTATIPGLFALPVITRGLKSIAALHAVAPYLAGAIVMGLTAIYTYLAHKSFSFAGEKSVPIRAGSS